MTYQYILNMAGTPWEVGCPLCAAPAGEPCANLPDVQKVMNNPTIICHQERIDAFENTTKGE